jgi:hypothetical protein
MARAPRGRSLSIGSLVQSKPTRARVHRRDELEAGRSNERATDERFYAEAPDYSTVRPASRRARTWPEQVEKDVARRLGMTT